MNCFTRPVNARPAIGALCQNLRLHGLRCVGVVLLEHQPPFYQNPQLAVYR